MRDYLCDDQKGDLLISNGDFVKGPSEQKHVAVIVKSPKGSMRRSPLTGVGALDYKYSNGDRNPALIREINLQLETAGFKSASVTINEDKTLRIDV